MYLSDGSGFFVLYRQMESDITVTEDKDYWKRSEDSIAALNDASASETHNQHKEGHQRQNVATLMYDILKAGNPNEIDDAPNETNAPKV